MMKAMKFSVFYNNGFLNNIITGITPLYCNEFLSYIIRNRFVTLLLLPFLFDMSDLKPSISLEKIDDDSLYLDSF